MTKKVADFDRQTGRKATNWRALISPAVTVLGALLLIQLLAALVLGFEGRGMEPAAAQGPLLSFDGEQVDRIHIDVPEGNGVQLAKTEEGWVVPSLGDLPAARAKVSDLLSKLGTLEKGLPVATSDSALKRFKVAEDNFERKLTLKSGADTRATLYLGDSPGFRRLFVRAEGQDAVYEAQLGLFDAPETPDAWSDRTLLHLDKDDVRQLAIGELTLENKDDDWRLADLAEGEEQDSGAIQDLVRLLTSIEFVGVLEAEAASAISQEVPPLHIQAVLKSGETIDYRISKLDLDNDYLLETSNRPQGFKLPSYEAEELAGIERAGLLMAAEQTAEAPPAVTPSVDATTADVANIDAASEDGVNVTPSAPSEAGATTSTGSPEAATEPATPQETKPPVPPAPATGAPEETTPQREP